jgi:hypothetical protein
LQVLLADCHQDAADGCLVGEMVEADGRQDQQMERRLAGGVSGGPQSVSFFDDPVAEWSNLQFDVVSRQAPVLVVANFRVRHEVAAEL